MTFYEAALRVLEAAGRPLHFQEITERSVQQSLLSHVGKTPELTMLSRLLAMARRKTDRKVVVTSKDMFALADWALPEEPDALAQTALAEAPEEENVLPLRPAERHPEARVENVRVAGRGAERKRPREDEDAGRKRKRRFPPIAEVVFELLSEARASLGAAAIAVQARERELAAEEMSDQDILTALLEDNQRRIDAGRRPQFVLDQQSGAVSLERGGAPGAISSIEVQAAFAAALGIPMDAGRPVLPKARPAPETPPELAQAHAALKAAAREARRAAARVLRRRLAELDAGTFEKTMVKLLHAMGFRELKVARRSKDGPLLIARKRDASLELRYGIRLLHGSATVDSKAVHELRRDLGHQSAHVGLIATPGELRGEARSEALGSGPLVFLWSGDALADKYLEAGAGVTVTRLESYELDDRFFDLARVDAQEAQRKREERLREKRRGHDREEEGEEAARRELPARAPAPRDEAEDLEVAARAPASAEGPHAPDERGEVSLSEADADADAHEDGDEGDEDLEEAESLVAGGRAVEGSGAPGQPAQASPGERRRRRRRRRGRRGRGRGQEGGASAGSPGAPAPSGEGALEAGVSSGPAAGTSEPRSEAPAPPAPPGAGEGSAA
jgi:ribonuclease E